MAMKKKLTPAVKIAAQLAAAMACVGPTVRRGKQATKPAMMVTTSKRTPVSTHVRPRAVVMVTLKLELKLAMMATPIKPMPAATTAKRLLAVTGSAERTFRPPILAMKPVTTAT